MMKTEHLLETEKLTQMCQDARFTKTVTKEQLVVTRSEIALEEQGVTCSCRE